MAEAEAPMAAEVEKEEEKGPRHYQIEQPYVCIGEPRVEYAPTPSSSSSAIVVEITWKRVRQYVTTINGTSTLDRRGPVETLGSSSSSFDAAALLAASASASASEQRKKKSWEDPTGDAWFDVVASFPAAAHLAPFLPGGLFGVLSFDLDQAIAERPVSDPDAAAATVLYKQELTILHTHIHDDRLVAVRDLLDEIAAAARLAGAHCGACHMRHRAELDFATLPCSHAFHINCIRKEFQRETRCPTCRRRYRRNNA